MTNFQFQLYLLISLFCVVWMNGCSEPDAVQKHSMPPGALGPLRTMEFEIKGVPVEIEVAVTQREQSQGLMYRESMPENHGMLFVYTEPRYMHFWMKNTKIPLSIAYMKEDGTISNIEKMDPPSNPLEPLQHYNSRYKCLYALEMNQGWFEKHGITVGDTLDLPFDQIKQLANTQDI